MANKKAITTTNFNARLKGVGTRVISIRTDLQEFLEVAGAYYMETNNALYLTTLRRFIHAYEGLDVKKFEAYVVDRYNVTKSTDKNKAVIFKPETTVSSEKQLFITFEENGILSEVPRLWFTTVPKANDPKALVCLDDVIAMLQKGSEKGLATHTPEAIAAFQVALQYIRGTGKASVSTRATKMRNEAAAAAKPVETK